MFFCNFIVEVFFRLGCRRRMMCCCWWNPGVPGVAGDDVPALLGAWKNSGDPQDWWFGDLCWWLSPGDGHWGTAQVWGPRGWVLSLRSSPLFLAPARTGC